jgi:hypothetical protein
MDEGNIPLNSGAWLANTPYLDALVGKAELVPTADVSRTFTNVDDAVSYTQGSEFSRRFNPTNERHLGIRADFQGLDRDARLPQSVINANAETKLKPLRVALANATTEATRLEIQQAINQIENRAWYSKRFYTDVNAATAPRDLKYYFAGGLKNQGVFTVPSPLTVVAGSEEAAMIPLTQHPSFGGATTNHSHGQEWIKSWKKQYNFPRLILQGGNEAKAASYLSTNTASELFPTAETIERYARPAGVIDPDAQTIELYGRTGQGVRKVPTLGRSERIAGTVGGVASLLLEAPENYNKATKRHREEERNKANANWWQGGADTYKEKPDTLAEKLSRIGKASLDSALSSITFGATSGQPDRTGMSRIGQERGGGEVGADESRRALIERSKNWTPK